MTYPENEPLVQWLEQETPEPVLEPELPIIDPHHHLWDIRKANIEPLASFQQKVYLCEEIMSDIQDAGHNIVQTVFAQCGAFYRADGPESMRCVGETEFVHGIAAMSRPVCMERRVSAPGSSAQPISGLAKTSSR